MNGFTLWRQRWAHCCPVRPGSCAATALHRFPSLLWSSRRRLSSSPVHAPHCAIRKRPHASGVSWPLSRACATPAGNEVGAEHPKGAARMNRGRHGCNYLPRRDGAGLPSYTHRGGEGRGAGGVGKDAYLDLSLGRHVSRTDPCPISVAHSLKPPHPLGWSPPERMSYTESHMRGVQVRSVRPPQRALALPIASIGRLDDSGVAGEERGGRTCRLSSKVRADAWINPLRQLSPLGLTLT
mmetsp:Transcript_8554/g.27948  ORF Transcript_8554/g.27948 Transcript_8554/m.27948 type:complete len:239 (-) Transcript_8554:213-929(-)